MCWRLYSFTYYHLKYTLCSFGIRIERLPIMQPQHFLSSIKHFTFWYWFDRCLVSTSTYQLSLQIHLLLAWDKNWKIAYHHPQHWVFFFFTTALCFVLLLVSWYATFPVCNSNTIPNRILSLPTNNIPTYTHTHTHTHKMSNCAQNLQPHLQSLTSHHLFPHNTTYPTQVRTYITFVIWFPTTNNSLLLVTWRQGLHWRKQSYIVYVCLNGVLVRVFDWQDPV
jgi:hypothetical protein